MWKNFFFDYIYYRLFHLNSNKGDYQGFPPVVVISLIQGLIIGGFFATLIRILFDRGGSAPYSKIFANIGIVLGIGLMIYNYNKYANKIEEFNNRWNVEDNTVRTIKGYMIIFTLLIAFVPLLVIGLFF